MSASRSPARWAARSAVRWCAARSAGCCGDRPAGLDTPVSNQNGARGEISVVASAARLAVPALRHRADRRRARSRDLRQRQDQGLSAVVLGRTAGAARPRTSIRAIPARSSNSSIRRCRRCCSRSRPGSARSRSISALSLLNAVAWWMTGQFSNAMTGSGRTPGPWLFALPGFVTITFIFDMFDLGQPNLVLLALMLYGFWLLQGARPWFAGCMFALATAIKVFPVAVLPYLVWRRQWKAVASTLVFLGVLPVRAAGAVPRLRAQCRGAEDLVPRHGRLELGKGLWPARRAELVLGQPVDHRGDAPADPAGQLQSGRSATGRRAR